MESDDPKHKHDLERKAHAAGWRAQLRLGRRLKQLPTTNELDALDVRSNGPRFEAFDVLVHTLQAKGKVPSSIDLDLILERLHHEDAFPFACFISLLFQPFSDEELSDARIFARHLVKNAALSAIVHARHALEAGPKLQADCDIIRRRLAQITKELEEFELYVGVEFAFEMRSQEDIKRDPEGRVTFASPDYGKEIFAGNKKFLENTKISSSHLRRKLKYLTRALLEQPEHAARDVLTTMFIEFMATTWRLLTGSQPGKGSTGPFVDFVATGWRMAGLPVPKKPVPKKARSRLSHGHASPRLLEEWIGRRIANHARERNWTGSRTPKK